MKVNLSLTTKRKRAKAAQYRADTITLSASRSPVERVLVLVIDIGGRSVKAASQTVTKGTRDSEVRLIEAGCTNLNAPFDYATKLLSAKSPSEAIERSTAQLRKQLETLSEQSKELATLAQKIATETTEPIREGVNKAFRRAA